MTHLKIVMREIRRQSKIHSGCRSELLTDTLLPHGGGGGVENKKKLNFNFKKNI